MAKGLVDSNEFRKTDEILNNEVIAGMERGCYAFLR